MATEDLGSLEWERSKISQQDVNLLRKLGISGKQDALRFPKEESYPTPPMQYRVSFIDHLIRGLSTPIHDFLRGLLFICFSLGAKGKETRLSTPVPPKPVVPTPEPVPDAKEKALDLYEAALVSSGDEEEDAPIDETARTSTSRTLVVSEARPDGDETSPPQQNLEHPTPAVSPQAPSPKRARVESTKEPTILAGCSSTPLMEEPFMKELIRFGTQFIGYRDYAGKLEEKLAEANRRADALATELEQSETARMKAEADAATVEDLQKRLDDAKML
ncbi:hypothetical protein QYE76_051875 [Lolium multiflorum]|uniref:Uncharacterized protein n=1 Tax=Lolium multiflorum TaxID=4521 RepID=A0AAD8WJ01_LOLMU|nr:hypothetical protein QYE76_051875 [Lolium multiflorum]